MAGLCCRGQELSESSKKTVLGSFENTLGRSRIVEALKQQWPDHELVVHDGDCKRDRDRKMRASVQGETDEREMRFESRDAWEQASWDEAASWEGEDDKFEGSIADADDIKKLSTWPVLKRTKPLLQR